MSCHNRPCSSFPLGAGTTILLLAGNFATLFGQRATSNIALNLVGDLEEGFHTHDGLDAHPVSKVHAGFHSHDNLQPHPMTKDHGDLVLDDAHEMGSTDTLGRRFGFAAHAVDYEEYGPWEDRQGMDYGEERSGEDNPFDDPFFKSFRPRKPKTPEEQESTSPVRSPEPTRAPPSPAREVAPTRQAFGLKKKKAKARPEKVRVEKQTEEQAGTENSEMIREFTLMISKLLFQLSQMKA